VISFGEKMNFWLIPVFCYRLLCWLLYLYNLFVTFSYLLLNKNKKEDCWYICFFADAWYFEKKPSLVFYYSNLSLQKLLIHHTFGLQQSEKVKKE